MADTSEPLKVHLTARVHGFLLEVSEVRNPPARTDSGHTTGLYLIQHAGAAREEVLNIYIFKNA